GLCEGIRLLLPVQHDRLAAPALDAHHLGVPGAAEDDDQPPFAALLVRDTVDLLHNRAGRIKYLTVFFLECTVYRARYPVRADQHPRPIRDFLERLGGAHAALLQPPDLVHIVDDLTISPDRAVFLG